MHQRWLRSLFRRRMLTIFFAARAGMVSDPDCHGRQPVFTAVQPSADIDQHRCRALHCFPEGQGSL